MKINVPKELKDNTPPTLWGRVLNATPIVMTVIATLLAGLSSSEMTKAQYDRSLAAQKQSKAGDQWAFFQAKRLRSAVQSGTLDVLQNTSTDRAIDAAGLQALAATLPQPAEAQRALSFLLSGKLPEQEAQPLLPTNIKSALDLVRRNEEGPELEHAMAAIKPGEIEAALKAAQAHAVDFDNRLRPVVEHGDRIGDAVEAIATPPRALARDFTLLRLRYASGRYDAEARLNSSVAELFELQVRQNNLSAERHHRRSQRFFFGMLAAQAAVIIATFAIAASQRSLLWALAAAAGLGALVFAAYVYVFL